MGITELAELVRAWLAEDERIAREAAAMTDGDQWKSSYHVVNRRRVEGQPSRTVAECASFGGSYAAKHIARHSPARTLAEVAGKRQLLDLALGWEHVEHEDDWHSCPAVAAYAATRWESNACRCGRDERVHAVLQTLATPYQEGS